MVTESVKVRCVDGKSSIVITLPRRIAGELQVRAEDYVILTSMPDGSVIITKEKAQ